MRIMRKTLSVVLILTMVLSLFTIVPFTAGAATTESAATGVSYSYRYDITLRMLPMNLYESDGWTLSEHSYDGISVSIYSGSGSQLGYSSAATMITNGSIWNTEYSFRFDTAEEAKYIELDSHYFFTNPDTSDPDGMQVHYEAPLVEGYYQNAENQSHYYNDSYEFFDFAEYSVSIDKVGYINRYWDTQQKKVVSETNYLYGNYSYLSSFDYEEENTLYSGWYLADGGTFEEKLTVNGVVNLILLDGYTTKLEEGIEVNSGNTLNVYSQSGGSGKLDVSISDNYRAAIGSDDETGCGTINIYGGNIVAEADHQAAGIGGGNEADGGNINIYGGTVNATGATLGAGIGGGDEGSGGNVSIYGGTVTAKGGENAAGIGGGEYASGGNVSIYGGTVTATGGEEGAGIGGGNGGDGGATSNKGDGGTVIINGGTVTATGGKMSAGIGGGDQQNGNTVIINGGNVTAKGGDDNDEGENNELDGGAGIGGGDDGSGGSITINGGEVNATGGEAAAGIGGGEHEKSGTIVINGGKVTAKGGARGGAGIGTGYNCSYDDETTVDVTINGGEVNAEGSTKASGQFGYYHPGAGIGSGGENTMTAKNCYFVGTINLNGGTVKAKGNNGVSSNVLETDSYGVGIGGERPKNGNIYIRGGNITAQGNKCLNASNYYYEDSEECCLRVRDFEKTYNKNERISLINGPFDSIWNARYKTETNLEITYKLSIVYIESCDHTYAYQSKDDYFHTQTCTYCGYSSDEEPHEITAGWDWSEDYLSATANFTCHCQYSASENATVSTNKENGELFFTATAVHKGITYTDTKSRAVDCFVGHSLTLDGDIGINYYVSIADEDLDEGVTVDFSWMVEGTEKKHSVTLTADDKGYKGYYKATCPVAVAEMTYDVDAVLKLAGEQVDTDTYSVRQYADVILSEDYSSSYTGTGAKSYENLERLVKTMLDYGAKAQKQFKRNTGNSANKGIEYSMADVDSEMITTVPDDMESGLSTYGLEYSGTTIVYLSKTSLRHYYTITDQDKFDTVKNSITFDGEKVGYTEKDGMIYFEKTNIAAPDLDTLYTLNIGESSYDYSVLDYVRECLDSDDVPHNTFLLVSATYWYSQAANAYFDR